MRKALFVAAMIAWTAISPARSNPHATQGSDSQRSLNLVGEIMDSRCAVNGSHDQMMRETGAKNARGCALACAKNGGSFVLYDPDTKTVYQLDDQQKPVKFAGQRVRVSGTYDQASKTMHVQSIEAAR